MRTAPRLSDLLLAAILVVLMYPNSLAAQSKSNNKPAFDISRMANSKGMFETFYVTETRPLRQKLDAGIVKEDTWVLVTKTAAGNLALLTDQMSFHHIAQGQAEGKEWMVTF